MKILEVSVSGTVGTNRMGPVSTDVCELSNHFFMRGHDVTVADLRCETPRPLLRNGVQLVELEGKPESWADRSTDSKLMGVWRRWRNYYQIIRRLAVSVELHKMDVVHVHAPELAFLLQRWYGLKVFYTAHTSLWSMAPDATPNAKQGKIFARLRALNGKFHAWIERDVARQSRLTIGVGDYLRSAIPDAAIETIPNGVYLEEWQPVDRVAVRRILGLDDRDFVILFAGRICQDKGIDILLEAVKLLTPSLPNLKVLLIGPLSGSFDTRDQSVEPYAQAAMECARELPVRFLGFINNREQLFKDYLALADVFVLPSRVEPQGKVVMESMALGTPVIGSKIGGIPDMVTSEVGYLFPRGDAQALATCIREAHDHPQQLRDMRLAARKRIELHYSWESVADRHLAAFARCSNPDSKLNLKHLPDPQ